MSAIESITVVYKTSDNREFKTLGDAKVHAHLLKNAELRPKVDKWKAELRAYYEAIHLDEIKCYCPSPVGCLLHFCTCARFHLCDRHVNPYTGD